MKRMSLGVVLAVAGLQLGQVFAADVNGPIKVSPNGRYFVGTGERRPIGTFRTGNHNGRTFPDGQTQYFTVPGHWEDAVLLLEGQ